MAKPKPIRRLETLGPSREGDEFSKRFVNGMRDRMLTSFWKYGPLRDNTTRCDCFKEARKRIREYRRTGNTEWLMDAANFLMMEFMFPKHRKAHFRPTDAHDSPGVSHLTVRDIEILNRENEFTKENR